jgi:hypothetical protein
MTPSAARRWERAVARVAFAALAALVVLALRQTSIGQRAVAAADAASEKSDWREAVAQARTAAEAVAPGSPWSARGFRRLEAIGHDAEARGDDPTALLAYGAMRTAALEARAPGTGGDAWRQTAEDGLARVAQDSKDAPRPRAARMLAALRAESPPSPWRLAALSLSVLATLGALGALAWAEGPSRFERVARGVATAGFVVYAAVLFMS